MVAFFEIGLTGAMVTRGTRRMLGVIYSIP